MNISAQPVLVINATYEPINICSVKRAMNLIVKGSALIEVARDFRLHRELRAPSVVRLRYFAKVPHRMHQVSRKNIYIRDGYCCQYCGEKFTARELTLDHVIPKSRGGLDRWENLVACCNPCNRRKDDRTLEEAGLKLIRPPRPLTINTSRGMIRLAGHEEPSWRKFLYY